MFSRPPKMNSACTLSALDSMYADAWACRPRGRDVDSPGHTTFFFFAVSPPPPPPPISLLLLLLPLLDDVAAAAEEGDDEGRDVGVEVRPLPCEGRSDGDPSSPSVSSAGAHKRRRERERAQAQTTPGGGGGITYMHSSRRIMLAAYILK